MSELIRKEPIVKFIQNGLDNKHYGYTGVEILTEIEYAPPVDAVEVVRCRECICLRRLGDGFNLCGTLHDIAVDDDFFCAYGERREENADDRC